MGFNCLMALETLRGDSLVFTTLPPGVIGTHLIDLKGWKTELTLEPPSGFEPRTLDWESSAVTTRALLNSVHIICFIGFK